MARFVCSLQLQSVSSPSWCWRRAYTFAGGRNVIDLPIDTKDFEISRDGFFQFTPKGAQKYLPYLQRIGVDIDSINTFSRFRTAHRIVRTFIIDELLKELHEIPPSLDQKWLLAEIQGDEVESQRLAEILQRKSQLGLKLIRSTPEDTNDNQ